MRTAQLGDRVQVHYVKRLQDGAVASSHKSAPLEVTVGVEHPRLPGLGLALVGMAPGTSTTVSVPPERGHGPSDPARIQRWSRSRFVNEQSLPVGKWVRYLDPKGRARVVRILEVRDASVIVDTNHRGAGQALELEIELVEIRGAGAAG